MNTDLKFDYFINNIGDLCRAERNVNQVCTDWFDIGVFHKHKFIWKRMYVNWSNFPSEYMTYRTRNVAPKHVGTIITCLSRHK